jgi:hypothetical protein
MPMSEETAVLGIDFFTVAIAPSISLANLVDASWRESFMKKRMTVTILSEVSSTERSRYVTLLRKRRGRKVRLVTFYFLECGHGSYLIVVLIRLTRVLTSSPLIPSRKVRMDLSSLIAKIKMKDER